MRKQLITKEIEIDMGHRVPNHRSKCSNPHGHRFRVEVGVYDRVIDEQGKSDEGMVIDFGDLKKIMVEEIDGKHDHGFMIASTDTLMLTAFNELIKQNYKIIVVPFIPTTENICMYFYNLLKPRLKDAGIAINHVRLWETPTSSALYEE